ncbi:hypothetical protein ACGF12_13700 [Kitasatospora sp. NPDC048296]|uniref:hypothetical protein n=1 Tax=Kitasatospora sp. NPDC048296 TaxID=3364048 RepID=UPI00371B7BD3
MEPQQPAAAQLAALRTMPNRPSTETLLNTKEGTVAIGRHADGSDATLELFSPDGPVCAAITGRPGSGIGALLDTLWDAEEAAGLVESWVVDLDGTHTANRPLTHRADTMAHAVELVTQASLLVMERVHKGLSGPGYEEYQPTAEQKLVTLTLVGVTGLLEQDKRIQAHLETIARWAARGGLHLRTVDRPGRWATGALGRSLRNGSLIELLAGGPAIDGEQALPGTGLLTQPFQEQAELFRTWPPMPAA